MHSVWATQRRVDPARLVQHIKPGKITVHPCRSNLFVRNIIVLNFRFSSFHSQNISWLISHIKLPVKIQLFAVCILYTTCASCLQVFTVLHFYKRLKKLIQLKTILFYRALYLYNLSWVWAFYRDFNVCLKFKRF